MLTSLLTLGVAFRAPAARPPATAVRSSSVLMQYTTGSYLDSTVRPATPMDEMEGSVQPVAPPAPAAAALPAAGMPPVAQQQYQPPAAYMTGTAAPDMVWTGPANSWTAPPTNTPPPEPDLSTRAARILGPFALLAGSVAGTIAFQELTAPPPISMDEVVAAQRAWGDAIVRISKTYLKGGDYAAEAAKAADELYGYGRTDVLFKPTKAKDDPFRPTPEGAMSYFIAGNPDYPEDHGFALGPDGTGWKKVVLDNNKIDFNGQTATAMGEYYFTDYSGKTAKVEYTFGYKRNEDGKIRINLHHSSLPYPGSKPAPLAPITLDEVIAAQREWGDTIVRISKTYLDGGDYVAAAAAAADALYGYGRTDVLFKPTKAADQPFRPTPEGALSYFVAGNPDFPEDHGFALGPDGTGWKKVVLDNNKVMLDGPSATAMGEYYFTATDGTTAKVEYTFGYKRNDDGKIRINLHHSSLPYKHA